MAEPIDYVVDDHRQVFLQEYIDGQSLETYFGAAWVALAPPNVLFGCQLEPLLAM